MESLFNITFTLNHWGGAYEFETEQNFGEIKVFVFHQLYLSVSRIKKLFSLKRGDQSFGADWLIQLLF